jgi:Rrf2 family protein
MYIPVKVDYGVRALVDLALHAPDGTVRAKDVARRTVIPEPFLAQVLHTLSKRGIVRSQRGPNGGHTLAMDASEIRLSMIMACLGVTDALVVCLDDSNRCIHVPSCAQREVWRSVDEAVHNILESTTIADLAERTRVLQTAMRETAQAGLHLTPTATGGQTK